MKEAGFVPENAKRVGNDQGAKRPSALQDSPWSIRFVFLLYTLDAQGSFLTSSSSILTHPVIAKALCFY